MAVQSITSKQQFEDVIKSPKLSVVHFCAEWAAQCESMNKVMEAEATSYKNAKFFKLSAEDLPDISLKYDITAVPTFVLFRSGNLVDRVNGADTPQLTTKITTHLGGVKGSESSVPASDAAAELNARLKRLISAAPVMLFMKGNAQEPRCGFSRQIIAILDELKADYKTFDILSDEVVRQGLKTFSNWPTYPQLYIKGELIGGLDIVKEMKETGDLAPMLPTKQSLDDRLRSLTKAHPCMVFMKGDRDTPRCGFSRQLMEILKEEGVQFKTFDILLDEEVRQGLKTFSNWPTYPQVYVNGELVGGLDIIKEMKEGGELTAALKGGSSS